MNDLDNIFIKYGTDKSSLFHNYSEAYSIIFQKYRHKKLNVLEIGVLDGNSIKSWEEYFVNSIIIGMDIDIKCKQYESDRIVIEIGNQTDIEFLKSISEKYKGFDIVIDDGGHTWHQQKTTFKTLFEYLNPGGIYVIEDLSTSYLKGSVWDTNEETTVEFLKRILDDLNLNGKSICGVKEVSNKVLNIYEKWIEYMFFFKGLCLIKKRENSL